MVPWNGGLGNAKGDWKVLPKSFPASRTITSEIQLPTTAAVQPCPNPKSPASGVNLSPTAGG